VLDIGPAAFCSHSSARRTRRSRSRWLSEQAAASRKAAAAFREAAALTDNQSERDLLTARAEESLRAVSKSS
jgi:hypothetical protein